MAISEDASTPAAVYSTGLSGSGNCVWTTASFSPPGGSLLVAEWSMGYSSSGTAVPTMSSTISGNPAWTLGPYNGASAGMWSYIWTLQLTGAPGSITCTLTNTATSKQGGLFTVRVLAGAAVSQIGAASASLDGSSSVNQRSNLVTTTAGSWAYVTIADNTTSSSFTPTASTTTISSHSDSTDACAYVIGRQTSATSTPGSTSLGWVVSASAVFAWAALEILPANTPFPATLAVTASIPVPAVHAYPAISTLADTFLGTTLNTALWTACPDGASGSVVLSNGLYLTDTVSTINYDFIESNSLYDLTNSAVYVQLVSAGTQGPVTDRKSVV
jgi:hypothetical protein